CDKVNDAGTQLLIILIHTYQMITESYHVQYFSFFFFSCTVRHVFYNFQSESLGRKFKLNPVNASVSPCI
ncbi:unnamed protein product, partial [Brassica napus]